MAHRESGISRLTERWPTFQKVDFSRSRYEGTPSSILEVKVFKSEDGRTSNRILFTCLRKMNAGVSDLQLCGYYMSCILTVFPILENDFTYALSDLGANVSIVTDDQFEVMAFLLTEPGPSPALLVAVCQLFLLLFKTISLQSYANDMISTIAALKPLAGYATTLTKDLIAATCEVASKIRIMLGSKIYLRRSLLYAILKALQFDSPLGYCCNYVAGMLSWTDMSEMVLINDVLLGTNSPVLGDARVALEVQRLHETFKEITQDPAPQYFGITTFGSKVRLLDRSRFTLLIEVARHIRAKQSYPTRRFISTPTVDGQIVLQLVALHEAFMKENQARSIGSAVQFSPTLMSG